MALTTTRHTTSRPNAANLAQYLPQPTPDQLLQRQIEDTLMLISALPETAEEKVIIDLGEGAGWFEIQCNQLELFMKLEELVEKLSPERKRTIIDGLHPAMSVRERKALKLMLERGLRRNVVPRPLNVRKVGQRTALEQSVDGKGREKLYTVPPKAEVENLVFPELNTEELALREKELLAARAEQSGDLDIASSEASATTADSRRRRQEIATMFSLAAKKLQVQEGSSSLERPVHSPTLKEGLHLIKTATSALRAYTDATPREAVFRTREDAVRPNKEASHAGEQLVRSSEQIPRPDEQLPRASGQGSKPTEYQALFQTSDYAESKISRPATEQSSPVPDNSTTRPHSDPSNAASRSSTCPWPDSFFTAPRTAPPPPPRSVSLPHPPAPPPPKAQPSPSHPHTNNMSSPPSQPNHRVPPAGAKRKGSISAARAGIADRIRRQQMEAMRGNLPYVRSSVSTTWSSQSSRGSRLGSSLGVTEEEGVEEDRVEGSGEEG